MLLGTDIVETSRIKQTCTRRPAFLNRVFTKEEQAHINESSADRKYERMAGKYAAKEAVIKAFGFGIGNKTALIEIEILPGKYGKPHATLYGNALKTFNDSGYSSIEISISNTTQNAHAVCIVF